MLLPASGIDRGLSLWGNDMPAYIPNASEVKKIADEVIEKHLPHLKLLSIEYIFRPEASVSEDRVTCGMCCRVDDRNWTIHRNDFIIEIAKDVWDEATDEFKVALVHHELSHCGIRLEEDGIAPRMDEKSGRIRTYCKPHEIEEFEQVLEVHGAYHKKLRDFIDAFGRNKRDKKKKDDTITTGDESEDVDLDADLAV